jgi:hypothetical protein
MSKEILYYFRGPNIKKVARRASWLAFLATLLLGAALNVIPFVRSYRAYDTDGYEIIGYPFIFRRKGGFVPRYGFNSIALAEDIVIFLALAVIIGIVVRVLIGRLNRRL